MAVTSTIAYCEDRDLQDIFPHIAEFDLKRRLYNWTIDDNLGYVYNSGLVTQLFKDGQDLGDAQASSGAVDAVGEWYYDSIADRLWYYFGSSNTNPNNMIMEAGDDWATIKTRFRRKASRLIESHLDNRLSREVLKDREGNYPEFIKRATALKACVLLVSSQDIENPIIEAFNDEFNQIIEDIDNIYPVSHSAR